MVFFLLSLVTPFTLVFWRSHSTTLSFTATAASILGKDKGQSIVWEPYHYLLNQFVFWLLFFGLNQASGMNVEPLHINILLLMSFTPARIKAKGNRKTSLDIKSYNWFPPLTFLFFAFLCSAIIIHRVLQ